MRNDRCSYACASINIFRKKAKKRRENVGPIKKKKNGAIRLNLGERGVNGMSARASNGKREPAGIVRRWWDDAPCPVRIGHV